MLPITGNLNTNIIGDELGYTMSIRHNLAGNITPSQSPLNSLTYFYRAGNVFTSGVPQVQTPFGMSAFYGQAALYRCVGFSASSSGPTGGATIVAFDKQKVSITFSSTTSYQCVRQNWDGNLAISGTYNATWSVGSSCSGASINTNFVRVTNPNYGKFGVLLYDPSAYNVNGDPIPLETFAYTASTPVPDTGWGPRHGIGTYNNTWWANPNKLTTQGRLNQCGIWSSVNPADGETFQVNFTFWSSQERKLYFGFGCDNIGNLFFNNRLILSQNYTGDNQNSPAEPFTFWHIYPVTFSYGPNSMAIVGRNISGPASIGLEIYANSRDGLIAAIQDTTNTQPDTLQVLFSTANPIFTPIGCTANDCTLVATASATYSTPIIVSNFAYTIYRNSGSPGYGWSDAGSACYYAPATPTQSVYSTYSTFQNGMKLYGSTSSSPLSLSKNYYYYYNGGISGSYSFYLNTDDTVSSISTCQFYAIKAYYSSSSAVCYETVNYVMVYSYLYNYLQNGSTYYYSDLSTPFDGSIHPYWSDNKDTGLCEYGSISSSGVYTTSGLCSPCA